MRSQRQTDGLSSSLLPRCAEQAGAAGPGAGAAGG
eukprot:SM015634S02001  [mRNA]  locus=s15634:26:176:- [translate_table: standard]